MASADTSHCAMLTMSLVSVAMQVNRVRYSIYDMARSIKVTYNPSIGLVQSRGPVGFSLDSAISYFYPIESVASVSSDTSIGTQSFIIVDASDENVTITLPTIAAGRLLSIKKVDSSSNTVTVTPAGSETIDGGVNAIITTQWTSLTLQAIDGNWYIR